MLCSIQIKDIWSSFLTNTLAPNKFWTTFNIEGAASQDLTLGFVPVVFFNT